jgi:hypothetical protein
MSSTAELHPETLRPGGWTCTSDLVGVSYVLLLLSYTRKLSMRVSSRGIEPLPSDCVGTAGLDKGSNLAEANPSPVPDGPTIDTHEMVPPRGIEPLPTSGQEAAPDGPAAQKAFATQRNRTSPDHR